MRGFFGKTEIGVFIALAVMLLAKLVLSDDKIFIGTVSLARALVVLGLLILWRTGLVSFGQALFFGLGGYTVGLLNRFAGISDILVLTALATLFSGLLAYVLGLLICRYREIFFAMLCLAFSMILYGVLVKTEVLGSSDGFNVVKLSAFGVPLDGEAKLTFVYVWMCLLAAGAGIGVHRYLGSTMGHLSSAIRDNEIRVEYLGASVNRTINVKFVIAGALAGTGGAVTAFAVGHVDPDAMVYWLVSGEFVFVTIFAGTGSIAAPFLGSVIFELLRTYAFQYVPLYWQMAMGTVLLLTIVFLPGGLWSLVQRIWQRD